MKEKFSVEIADVPLSILSDEKEEFVKALVSRLDQEIRDLTVHNKRCSKLDAALLCALDYCSEKVKADKRIRNLEAQISLYDANLRRLREENAALTAGMPTPMAAPSTLAESGSTEAPAAETPAEPASAAPSPSAADAAEEPVQQSIGETQSAPAETGKEDAPAGGKLRQLELMLRGMKDGEETR